ncbi:YhgE/Pip domain-containing protein [Bacillus sp. REN16]|uniref:YhgE/Pip domain-containing protein n=1 Tax=Bacillus sp. REN16 TaxID=2887296 RepID=UPI001E589303|nr:ABC transporter permease [Bacillus sp. REN16]MCC3359663.1 ABC transporter permease [Bacillus sp. REN16]
MKFTQFLKTKGAIGAIVMGLLYSIAMVGIFLPGYAAIPGNVDKLPIAIVNDDIGENGEKIAEQLLENLPFKEINTDLTNKQALKDLEKNDLALVIHIPKTFSADIQKGETSSSIDFTINEAGSTAVASTMNSVVNEINYQLSSQFSQQTAQGVLMNFNVPEEQSAELAKKIETAYVENVVKINEVPDGMNHQNLPMFLSMAGYVAAMIGSMQLIGAFKESRGKASKSRLFMYVQLAGLMIAVISSLAAVGIVYLVNEPSGDLFFGVLGQQILNYMVCFNFTGVVIFLLGEGGMILNLPILLAQTIASGAIVTREMMYLPYEWLSHISPMYYSVQAYLANLYGSISPSPYIWSMVAVGAVAMLISIVIVMFIHKPMPVEGTEAQAKTENVKNATEVTV